MSDDELLSRRYPVREDISMQQRVWRFERIGWYVLLVIVLSALAGLFGKGPLSDAEMTSKDGRIRVEYQRFSRSGTTDSLFITVQGTSGQPVTIALEGPLLRQASIETLQPQPQVSMSDGTALLFQLGAGKDGMATLYLTLRSEHVGPLQGNVKAGPNSAVRFSTFLFP